MTYCSRNLLHGFHFRLFILCLCLLFARFDLPLAQTTLFSISEWVELSDESKEKGLLNFPSFGSTLRTYGDTAFILHAWHDLGKPVYIKSSKPNIVRIDSVGGQCRATIVGAGQADLVAVFDGDSEAKKESLTQMIYIRQAELTVTANNQSRPYFAPNPDVSNDYVISGYVEEFAERDKALFDSMPAAYINPDYNQSPVGSYDDGVLVEGGEHPYYTFNYQPGVLTIIDAPGDAITFQEVGEKTYGDPVFLLTAQHEGSSPVYFETKETDVLNIREEREGVWLATILKAGTALVFAKSDATGEYPSTYALQEIVIHPAELVVAPTNFSRMAGIDNPEFTVSVSPRMQYSDRVDDLGEWKFSTTAKASSPPGDYPITLTLEQPTALAANYQISFQEGRMRILETVVPVFDLSINGQMLLSGTDNPEDTCRYIAACGEHQVVCQLQVDGNVTLKIDNNVALSGNKTLSLSKYGDNYFHIEATPQDGSPSVYTLAVTRPVPADQLIYQRWGDVLAVKKALTDSLANYVWYKDGEEITEAKGKGYVNMEQAGQYSVEANGRYLGHEVINLLSCPAAFDPSGNFIVVYPTLVRVGQLMTISTLFNENELASAQYQLISTSGETVQADVLSAQKTTITVPDTTTGEYILRVLVQGMPVKQFKILVK